MEPIIHTLSDLFMQLGLPNQPGEIDSFVATHRPVPNNVALSDAPFWNEGQRQLLRDGIVSDADWAEVIDSLNILLRT